MDEESFPQPKFNPQESIPTVFATYRNHLRPNFF